MPIFFLSKILGMHHTSFNFLYFSWLHFSNAIPSDNCTKTAFFKFSSRINLIHLNIYHTLYRVCLYIYICITAYSLKSWNKGNKMENTSQIFKSCLIGIYTFLQSLKCIYFCCLCAYPTVSDLRKYFLNSLKLLYVFQV